MKVRLLQSGDISTATTPAALVQGVLEREAIFVYEGTFQSMDGEVTVSAEQLRKLAANHNARYNLSILKAASLGKDMNLADCPPVQVDHSASGWDTVGRVVGPLAVVDYVAQAGKEPVAALMGRLRFIGEENCERASDGRWTHLSVGADFEEGVLNELTVTPFPAAANAVMLKAEKLSRQIYKKVEINTEEVGGGKWKVSLEIDGDGEEIPEKFDSNAAAFKAAKAYIDDVLGTDNDLSAKRISKMKRLAVKRGDKFKFDWDGPATVVVLEVTGTNALIARVGHEAGDKILVPVSELETDGKRLSQGEGMDKEKLKAHLKKKGMSEEEADKHLASCDEEKMKKLAAEAEEDDKKMAADEKEKADKLAAEEKEKAEKLAAEENEEKEKAARMSAAKLGFTRLAKGMKKGFSSAKLEARKNGIAQRLSALRATNKLTPAEQKNIDVVKLSAKSDLEVSAFFSAFEAREQIVPLGQFGSAKAEPVAKIAVERKKLSRKQEHLNNMPFTKSALGDRLGKEVPEPAPVVRMTVDPAAGDVENLNSRFASVCKMMDEGKREDALNALKGWMESQRYASDDGVVGDESMARMSALAEENKKLQNQFEELVTLVAPILGVESSELDA